MGRIVVATDGSDGSAAAVAEGIDLARRLGSEVVFVAVRPSVPGYLGAPLYQQRLSKDMVRARQALDHAREQAEHAGIKAEYEILEGDAAEAIARLAESRDADLVVVGTRGLAAAAGDLLGSVSAGVVRRSRRPVVVVRHPGERRSREREAVAVPRVRRDEGPAPA
jgi:nucleotide-binding universal stress UspA family protein